MKIIFYEKLIKDIKKFKIPSLYNIDYIQKSPDDIFKSYKDLKSELMYE